MKKRGSGILCHITSLRSPYGIGDLGPGANAFAEVDYAAVSSFKQHLFKRAHTRFKERETTDPDYQRFCKGHASWLEDHALFTAISDHLGGTALCDWPKELSNRQSEEVKRLQEELSDAVQREKFLQFTFYNQLHALKNYCNGKGIQIIGDFPLELAVEGPGRRSRGACGKACRDDRHLRQGAVKRPSHHALPLKGREVLLR